MMHKKVLFILLITAVFFGASVAYAQGAWWSGSFTLSTAERASFEVFSDFECTIPMPTEINLGDDLVPGDHIQQVFYVKNVSGVQGVAGLAIYPGVGLLDVISYTTIPFESTAIDAGEVESFYFIADILEDAPSEASVGGTWEIVTP